MHQINWEFDREDDTSKETRRRASHQSGFANSTIQSTDGRGGRIRVAHIRPCDQTAEDQRKDVDFLISSRVDNSIYFRERPDFSDAETLPPRSGAEVDVRDISVRVSGDAENTQTVRKPEPMWERGPHRTGRYGEIDQISDSETGYRKLESLTSGMSIGTGKTYIRGWKRWAQYCSMRWMSQWVAVGKPGRGGKILDFIIMFGHAVL